MRGWRGQQQFRGRTASAAAWAARVSLGLWLSGCGVPLGWLDKPPTTQVSDSSTVRVVSVGATDFSPGMVTTPVISTGELEPSTAQPTTPRGVAVATYLGDSFPLTLSAGAAVQLVASGPSGADLVVLFNLNNQLQRIDDDPLAPEYGVESLVLSSQQNMTLYLRATDYNQRDSAGLVRWYAWLLPSSQGTVSSTHESQGPAGVTEVGGSFSFTGEPSGARQELLVAGPVGSDLLLRVTVGDVRYKVDHDAGRLDHRLEGLRIDIDDPTVLEVEVDGAPSSNATGDVYWAVVRLPDPVRSHRDQPPERL